MLEKINKIPAGTFLVPLVLSMIVYTIWPNLFMIGGMTQAMFSGQGVNVLAAILTFLSGTVIDIKQTGRLIKRQGVLFIAKVLISMLLSYLFIQFFGQSGVLGISAVAFVSVITSTNPAIYLLTAQQYGNETDTGAFGFFGLLSLPIVPTIVYSLVMSGGGGIDWMPVISIFIPLLIGIVLGAIDRGFSKLFSPGIAALLPIMGWNLGQGINILDALRSGVSGLIVTVIFIVFMLSLVLIDTLVLKNDGLLAISLVTVAGVSSLTPSILARIYPELVQYVATSTSQILMAVVITSVSAPIVVSKLNQKKVKKKERPLTDSRIED